MFLNFTMFNLLFFRGEGLTTVSDGPLHDQCQGIVAPQLVKG